MGHVLFTSSRPLERAENLKAVWDAYDGEKAYFPMLEGGTCPEAEHAEELFPRYRGYYPYYYFFGNLRATSAKQTGYVSASSGVN